MSCFLSRPSLTRSSVLSPHLRPRSTPSRTHGAIYPQTTVRLACFGQRISASTNSLLISHMPPISSIRDGRSYHACVRAIFFHGTVHDRTYTSTRRRWRCTAPGSRGHAAHQATPPSRMYTYTAPTHPRPVSRIPYSVFRLFRPILFLLVLQPSQLHAFHARV